MARSKPTITYKKKDEIAVISMNRPEYNNAQNGKMTYDLDKAFKRAIDDDGVKVIVLKGNGKHFSAGLILERLAGMLMLSMIESLCGMTILTSLVESFGMLGSKKFI